MYDLNDTIVAVSSAAGGVRSIVRLTGPQAFSVCEQVFESDSEISNLRSQISDRTILGGSVRIAPDLSVDALLYPFLGPRSYTGQDLIELHVRASPCLVEALLEKLLAKGCRTAGPGEFTARAYLNGKLDLAQAEAVNEIVSSSNSLQLEAAERLLGGRLTKTTEQIRSDLLDVLSLIEAGLDFSGEDIEFISADQAVKRLTDIRKGLEDLLAGSIRCETLMDLPAVGIAGAPNAGKSSLLNALLGWERSIVSPQAKTTRDVLTAVVGWALSPRVLSQCDFTRGLRAHPTCEPSDRLLQCVLFDCAGLIPSPDNVLDELAQHAALAALQHCSAVLFCVDSAKADWTEDLAIRTLIQPKSLICVATKSDLAAGESLPRRTEDLSAVFGAQFLPVSATKRTGLDELVRAVEHAVCSVPVRAYVSRASCPHSEGGTPSTQITPYGVTTSAEPGDSAVALTARHRQAVTEAVENVRQAMMEVQQGREEVAVMMIRAACEAVSGLSRQHLDEQVLDRIFSRFCVGK
jgi:tRNA modification GTPase